MTPVERTQPTLDDVARLSGVSRATASRVLRNPHAVSPQRRQSVEEAVRKLGYVPNMAARALVSQRVGVVALLVPEPDARVFNDPFFAQLYQGALEGFADSDTRVVLSMSQPGERPDAMASFLASGHVDGALVASHHGSTSVRGLVAASRPLVFIGDPGEAGVPFVDLDQEQGVELAVARLVERGARRVATISGPLDMLVARRRLDAFRLALARSGLTPKAEVEGDFTRDGGERAAERLLAAGDDFDALFVASDMMSVGALTALRRAGRRVPEDVLLASFDDSQVATHTLPPLTTVGNPAAWLGREGAVMLRDLMAGRLERPQRVVATQLVLRESA